MKLIDGLKTYIGIGVVFLSGLVAAINPSLISKAFAADAQWTAIINIAFIVLGGLLAAYGRIDAQRKINSAKNGDG
ncbi:MAG: hypothetical protein L3J15_05865 [Devosiaceae bacterium]|nr:hypothetical protein [Devosiaceae bacterium]